MTDELIGKNFGGYEVQGVVGHGGMATVYLARQQSMNRQVALKVLPLQFMRDDTYLQRFEREVKIVSQLEHRNIVPVYDYGEEDGQPYIVMRYMPAGSVDDQLRLGAMPTDKIMSIIAQIAPALDYAHSKEVLHRDLKPSNVLMDDGGGAFITDFGIARIAGDTAASITTQGVVGTPSYMSPEQAQGKAMDGRSDLYSLGVMLFEMATGRRPFESETAYSIAVMQVTTPPPQPRSINPQISAAVEHVILKALRKNPDERYPTAVALMEALQLAIDRPGSVFDTEPSMRATPAPSAPVSLPPSPPVMYPQAPSGPRSAVPAYSEPLQSRISRRRKNSPWVSVLIGGSLGCGLVSIIAIIVIFAASFLLPPADITATVPTATTQAALILTQGTGTPPAATPTLDATSETARQTLLARSQDNDATLTAVAQFTAAAPTRPPGLDPIGVRGTPTLRPSLREAEGSLIFADLRGEEIPSFEIIRLDLDTWIETQLTQDGSDNIYPQPSPDGRWIVFQSNRRGPDYDIYVMNTVGGQLTQLTNNGHDDRLPSWSPDGEWIVYASDVRSDGTSDLYRIRPDGSDNQPILSNTQRMSHPRYSPDGRYLVFTTGANPNDARTWDIARLNLETMQIETLTDNDVRDASPVFTADGAQILYITTIEERNAIAIMNLDGSDQRIVYNSSGNDWAASPSPDGRFIVFSSDLTGTDEIFMMTIAGDEVQQITSSGGTYPSWIPSIDSSP